MVRKQLHGELGVSKNTVKNYLEASLEALDGKVLIGTMTRVKKNCILSFPIAAGCGQKLYRFCLGHLACQLDYKVNYFIAQKLFAMLRMSKADESYIRQIRKLEKQDILIIDDFGMQPLDEMSRMMLL